jgi:hypothetical protein
VKLLETLGTVAWGMFHFSCVQTGGPLKLRDIRGAVARGFVRSNGFGPQCGYDGACLDNRQEREGWVLTDAGKAYLSERDPDTAAEYLGGDETEGGT